MLWSNNLNRLTGYTMVLTAACLVLGIATGIIVSDQDPTIRSEVEQTLIAIEDNNALAIISTTFFILLNIAGLFLAGLFYLLFRDRSPLLSIILLIGFVTSSATGFLVEGFNIGLIGIAHSYVNGGAGLAAGDPALLDIANFVAHLSGATDLMSFTTLGVALLALGVIIWEAPAGRVNPPRLFGLVAILAALSAFLAWIVIATDIGVVLFAVQGIASLVFLLGGGGWLIMNPGGGDDPPATDAP